MNPCAHAWRLTVCSQLTRQVPGRSTSVVQLSFGRKRKISLSDLSVVCAPHVSVTVPVCVSDLRAELETRFELSSTNIPKDKRPLTYY
jgi:hypothetical protein